MIEPTEYRRKTYRVQAVWVTEENIIELTKWCGGQLKIETSGPGGGLGEPFIVVPVDIIAGRQKTLKAHLGDWITLRDDKFNVHSLKSFRAIFEKADVDELGE